MDAYEFSDVKPVIISAVIVLNIITNCLVIAVIARYAALREDRTTLFMCSLCVSDLAGGCTAMPISAALCSRATPTVRLSTRYLPEIQMFCLVVRIQLAAQSQLGGRHIEAIHHLNRRHCYDADRRVANINKSALWYSR